MSEEQIISMHQKFLYSKYPNHGPYYAKPEPYEIAIGCIADAGFECVGWHMLDYMGKTFKAEFVWPGQAELKIPFFLAHYALRSNEQAELEARLWISRNDN